MTFLSDITLAEWIIMIVVFAIIGAAYWLIDDSRKRGMAVGGKVCGGCPHSCQLKRNCDGTPKTIEDPKSEINPMEQNFVDEIADTH